jgi:pentatricopeptide repeat protein
MSPSKGRKRRRKTSHSQSIEAHDGSYELLVVDPHHVEKQQLRRRQVDRQKIHEEKLALSQKLRQLSSQKRLKECVDLYESAAHDELRDAHHGSIAVDCCARCGDVHEAERIVSEMLSQQSSRKSQHRGKLHQQSYFWEDRKQFSYKQVPIQAWTALLKGYVHSGMMAKAYSLFNHLCDAHRSALSAIDGESGRKKNRKTREVNEVENGPNVRTFNTLLRGCLWTATLLTVGDTSSVDSKNELVGGVVTAGRAWLLCEDVNITGDSSSYEYYISLLSQSLQCRAAENCLRKMRVEFGIRDCINVGQDEISLPGDMDPTIIESFVFCLVALARGFALLGGVKDARRCAEEALRYLDLSSACNGLASPSFDPPTAIKQTTGGKKAWRDRMTSVNSRDDGNSTGRRDESNRLFRSHRQSELRSEASALRDLFISHPEKQADCIATKNASFVAQMMLTRLLYFSGGGTTDRDAMKIANNGTDINVENDTQRWINSLWHSFGLRETMQRLLEANNDSLENVSRTSASMMPSNYRNSDAVLSKEFCRSLRAHVVGEDSVICDKSGRVRFARVFKCLNGNVSADVSEQSKPVLHIELGAGSGDWACLQANLNSSDNYVTVELRADRVAQTFAKCLLRQGQRGGQSTNIPLTNLCCIGSECGSFLRERVAHGSVKTIFVNHPEPPTQTYNDNSASADEPAHILNSQTILSASHCLEPMGKGMLVVVTDNHTYARFICQSLVRMLEGEVKNLVGLCPGEVRDLTVVKSFGSSIRLYEGKPSESIRHYTPKKVEGGHSYFDRLWRTGAGKHAEIRKRYIIGLRTIGGNCDLGGEGARAHRAMSSGKPHCPNGGDEKKSAKKRGLEKQMRRNERRLLKKK